MPVRSAAPIALRYSVSIRAWAHRKLIRQIVLTVTWTKLKSSNARTIRIRQDASVTTAEPAIAVARDQVIDRVADHPWDEVEDPCPLPARKLARNAQRGFGFYIGLAGRHERKGSRAIRIDAQLLDAPDEKSGKAGLAPKSILNANKDAGNIKLDSETQLTGVPPEAWTYKLGNRSAVEWILDQYKEKTPKDPTIREKFNTYRFYSIAHDEVPSRDCPLDRTVQMIPPSEGTTRERLGHQIGRELATTVRYWTTRNDPNKARKIKHSKRPVACVYRAARG